MIPFLQSNTMKPSFQLPFRDLGSGVVSTAEIMGGATPTFTRATIAWTKLSSGLWGAVASGSPRATYLGATTAVGAYGGYFAEGSATQLVTPLTSVRDMTDASWAKVTVTAAKTATGIDGVTNSATRLTATGATSTILQTLVASGSSRTYSVWLRRVSGTGTINLAQGVTTLDVTASLNSSTYTRVELNANVLNAAYGIQIITNGDVIEADFNQFESNAFATSPIDVGGGTRNADVLTYPLTLQASYTWLLAGTAPQAAAATLPTALATGGDSGLFFINGSTRTVGGNSGGGTFNSAFSANTYAAGIGFKAAFAAATNDAAGADGGTSPTTDATFTPTTGAATVTVGAANGGATNFFGPISNVRYFPQRLPNATLQSLTA